MPILSQLSAKFKTARTESLAFCSPILSDKKSHHAQSTLSFLSWLSFSTRGGLNQDGHRVQKHDLLTRWPPLITIDSLLQDGRH